MSYLPIELLDIIMENSPQANQASLGTTSKLLNEVATRHLYRDIKLTSPSQIVRCCKTLVSNASASAATRKLFFGVKDGSGSFPPWVTPRCRIRILPNWSSDYILVRFGDRFQVFYRLIARALQKTCHLTTLKLLPVDWRFSPFLHEVYVPELRDLAIAVVNTSLVSCFLDRHSKIDVLQLICVEHDSNLYLPALFSFKGCQSVVTNLARSSSLMHISVAWEDATDVQYESTLKSLAHTPITILGSGAVTWSSHFFDAVARYLPNLTHLSLQYTVEPSKAVSLECSYKMELVIE